MSTALNFNEACFEIFVFWGHKANMNYKTMRGGIKISLEFLCAKNRRRRISLRPQLEKSERENRKKKN
jgi:hypothetical protein